MSLLSVGKPASWLLVGLARVAKMRGRPILISGPSLNNSACRLYLARNIRHKTPRVSDEPQHKQVPIIDVTATWPPLSLTDIWNM
jgi:hypothetical protein